MEPLQTLTDYFQKNFLSPLGKSLRSLQEDPNQESRAYHAASFKIDHQLCLFRCAKTTGTRPGQFLTLWKRPKVKIEPFDLEDQIKYVIVATEDPNKNEKGFFIFPTDVLLKKNIISNTQEGKKGKLAFRIFPPWTESFIPKKAIKSEVISASSKKSQKWQVQYYCSHAKELASIIDTTNK